MDGGLGRQDFERVKSIKCREAERVDATDDRGVDQSGLDDASRRAESLRTTSMRCIPQPQGPFEITAHELRRPSSCCVCAGNRALWAALRWPGPGDGRRSRSRGSPRYWCRRKRRCGRRRNARVPCRPRRPVHPVRVWVPPPVVRRRTRRDPAAAGRPRPADFGDHRVEPHRFEPARREREALGQRSSERVVAEAGWTAV